MVGTGPGGEPAAAARVVALHGAELFNLPVATAVGPRVWVTTDRPSYQRGQTLTLSVQVAPGSSGERLDAYAGLRRPDRIFLSLRRAEGVFTLATTGSAPEPAVRNDPLALNFSAPAASYAWGPGDPTGSYAAYVVLVRAGQSPLNPADWVAIDSVSVTLSP